MCNNINSDKLSSYKRKKERRILFYSSVNHKDLFVVTGFYSTDISILQNLGFKVTLSNSFKDFFKFWQYDIAFIYFWTKGLVPAFISKIFNKKVIFTGGIDNIDREFNKSELRYKIRKNIFRLCTLFSNANIIVSMSDLKNIKKTGYKIKNLYLLPHVIDFERYAYDNTPKKNIISTVVWMENKGNVTRKGVDKLLYVFREYLNLKQDLTIQIIGTIGEGTDYLRSIAKELNIENRIIFTGRINEENKIKYLKESKYYFQLSEYEGFGIAAIEALASGNIVIHSGKGGLADTIGSFGIIVENVEDYKNIALKLDEINRNYEKYFDLISRGIKHVKDNFSYNIRKEKINNLMNSLFDNSKKIIGFEQY